MREGGKNASSPSTESKHSILWFALSLVVCILDFLLVELVLIR